MNVVCGPNIVSLQSVCLRQRIEVNIGHRPQLRPSFEADLQEVTADTSGIVNTHHSLGKATAASVFSGFIQVTGGVAGGPYAFSTVFTPRNQRLPNDRIAG